MHPIVICLDNCVPFYSFDDYGKAGFENNNAIPSKIFDLLHHTSFTENCLNVKADGTNLIEPQKLLSIITKFDHEKCRKVSVKYRKEYNNMMDEILKKLTTLEN